MGESLLGLALPNVHVSSAGLSAMVGYGADPLSIKIMSEMSLDIESHRARMISEQLVRENDLIFVMELNQKEEVERRYPFARGKVFRLGESFKQDIADPYQGNEAVFRSSFELIAQGCEAWVKRIASIS